MGLFDNLESALSAGTGSAEPSGGLFQEALGLIQNHPGGISGLVNQFESQGLGGVVQSWVGNGQNQPVTSDQIQQVLGSDTVQQLAAKFGVDPSHVSAQLSELMPQIINHLTPEGQVPAGGVVSEGLDFLKGKLLG